MFWYVLVITYGGVFQGEKSRIPFPDEVSCGHALAMMDKALNVKNGAEIEMIQCKETEVPIE